jgi:hypothetical protein
MIEMISLEKLRKRAEKHGMRIATDRKTDSYILFDIQTNCVAAYPALMTIEEVEAWLDDLDAQTADDGASDDTPF